MNLKSPAQQLKTIAQIGLLVSWTTGCGSSPPTNEEGATWTKEQLGEALFFDKDLSLHRTQACATCHDPRHGFVDARLDQDRRIRSGSLGDDGMSIGDRNAPSAAYAAFSPAFSWTQRERFNTDSDFSTYQGYMGGLFHDGRAETLEQQAGGPPLNPKEMALPDEAAALDRLLEDGDYERTFRALYGDDIFEDPKEAYAALADAIAAFERTEEFSPFDSRYDRSLLPADDDNRYVFNPASKAALGKALFFSAEFTNCSACHQLQAQTGPGSREEIFTGFEYHNLGVPENVELRALSGANIDLGLGGHLRDAELEGMFKTPTLRNVAVTSPYMHNGIFRELSTVIAFYEHRRRISRGEDDDSLNPETDQPWAAPEVDRNLSQVELASGNKDLTEPGNIEALACFLLSLTDARYERLLDPDEVERCGL